MWRWPNSTKQRVGGSVFTWQRPKSVKSAKISCGKGCKHERVEEVAKWLLHRNICVGVVVQQVGVALAEAEANERFSAEFFNEQI